MKQVQYTGEEVGLGRFGVIRKGAKLDMYEWEWDAVQNDTTFRLLTVLPSNDEVELSAKTKPRATRSFDLRTIPWENKNLHKLLASRMSKQTLIKLVKAINEVGGYIEDSSSGEQRNALIDKIISAARSMSWDKMDKTQRLSLDTDRESVKPARQRVKKTIETEANDN